MKRSKRRAGALRIAKDLGFILVSFLVRGEKNYFRGLAWRG